MSLNISLISSFAPAGMFSSNEFELIKEAVGESFQGKQITLDAYIFMESDSGFLSNEFGNGRQMSAFQFLEELRGQNLSDVVEQLITRNKCHPPIALTSFLPEISQHVDAENEKRILDAVVGLFRIAIQIGVETGQTPVVQMVAGNMLDRVESLGDSSTNKFCIVSADENSSYHMVLHRLSACFKSLSDEFENQPEYLLSLDKLRIAFELEPGPLYLLDGPMSIVRFCQLIENHENPAIQKHIGFNLDIAHWWLKNIRPEFIEGPLKYLATEYPNGIDDEIFRYPEPLLKNRIFHSHISGHSRRAHFGDISLSMMAEEDKQLYIAWLSKLVELSQTEGTEFSGYVSLEFEAARSRSCVVDSTLELLNLLDRANPD